MASPSEKKPVRRRDAEENRARIVAAAREVYASAGFDAPFDAIARHAGVGRATLYRNFPDRYALGAAIIEHNLAALEALAREHSDRPDAFTTLLSAIVEQHTEAHALVPALLRGPGGPDVLTLVRRVTRLLTVPLQRARAAGLVRDDLTVDDVIDVLAMISAVVTGDAPGRSRERRVARVLELLMHGLVPREPI
ncbi:TetR/AcrR family transcriptional regulator [Polyangium aurulentum]|uniref:TetR/AcrR family transcriptional regulator n=1 Tax=Polyangium aurulentum TaxID=2567896 RepID=UPI0010AE4657|nr:TetR/AcrR family transcriptional regulator [Polyangium aurulentum]UQA56888.1 TetR/AcrR family transcriptional regulator [Polyangium aurulentum]